MKYKEHKVFSEITCERLPNGIYVSSGENLIKFLTFFFRASDTKTFSGSSDFFSCYITICSTAGKPGGMFLLYPNGGESSKDMSYMEFHDDQGFFLPHLLHFESIYGSVGGSYRVLENNMHWNVNGRVNGNKGIHTQRGNFFRETITRQ